MSVSKEQLDTFCENLQDLEDQKKVLSTEIKESIETFAVNNEISKKSVSKFFKEWKEATKNKDDYVLVDYESDELILIAFPELASAQDPAND